MPFRKIQLAGEEDFLQCAIATTVLHPDIRKLRDIAERVIKHGYEWCIANRDPEKDESWWRVVQRIQQDFSWEQMQVGDPITAKVFAGSLEFGSIQGIGGGCHRSIALAAAILLGNVEYRPFEIQLYCP